MSSNNPHFWNNLLAIYHSVHFNVCGVLQEVMSMEDETTSCYCLMDSNSCHLLLDRPGCYALVGEPFTEVAVKRLKLAVFGNAGANSMDYNLRVYCVDDTPNAFQVPEFGFRTKVSTVCFHALN